MKFKELLKLNILFDSHCHLNFDGYDEDINSVVRRSLENGVEAIIDISTDLTASQKSLDLSMKFNGKVFSAVGIDPEVVMPGSDLQIKDFDLNKEMMKLEQLLKNNNGNIIMIGEIGLDNYWLSKNEELSVKTRMEEFAKQIPLFKSQLYLAEKYNLPVSIHSRGAIAECIEIVKRYKITGIFHSLTNDTPDEKEFYEQVNEILDLGFHVGINAISTYKSADMIRNVFKKIYFERVGTDHRSIHDDKEEFLKSLYKIGFVFETDGPFLLPQDFIPTKSRRNEPASIKNIFDFLYKYFGE